MSLAINHISLFQFKNYFQQEFAFTERIVGICGPNGRGKTNLLDALHYLCFTKSYFTRHDQWVAQQGRQGFRVEGIFQLRGRQEQALCVLRETGRKEFSINGQPYQRFSQHIGRYPCVVIAPDDVQLIIGGSEERRKFVDTLLSQLDGSYLQHLIAYTRIVQQRNSFLKNYHDGLGSRDLSVLDVLDEQLVAEGQPIFEKRERFLMGFLADVKHQYNEIARHYEPLQLYYESELLSTSMVELLQRNRAKDLMIQRSSGGVHRDDLLMQMGEQPFRNIASQGQRKSLLFALKLTEMAVLRREKMLTPLLLLDDVFEKLDEQRIANLLQQVSADGEGQVFITDTSRTRLTAQLEALKRPFQIIEL